MWFAYMYISSGAAVVWLGKPTGISRAGAGACTTPSVQDLQAYLGRRVTPVAHANMRGHAADHAELGGHNVQPFRDVLADATQGET